MIYSPRTYSIGHQTPPDQEGNPVIVVLPPVSMGYLQVRGEGYSAFSKARASVISSHEVQIYLFTYVIYIAIIMQ